MTEEKLTTVYIATGITEAGIVKGRLESEGIPAILRYESAGLVYGITVNGLGQVRIQVPIHLAEIAKKIIGSTQDAD